LAPNGTLLVSATQSTPIKGQKSSSHLKGTPDSTNSKDKKDKKGFFGTLLKRKSSRADLKADGYNSDSSSVSTFRPPHTPAFDTSLALPAKLQARGDAVDMRVSSSVTAVPTKGSKIRSKSKKPSTPNGGPVPPGLGARHASVFNVDPNISLDTNMDEMDGIVDMGIANGTDPNGHTTRANSNASSLDDDPGAVYPSDRRPSIPPRSARGDADPHGGVAFPNPANSFPTNASANAAYWAAQGVGQVGPRGETAAPFSGPTSGHVRPGAVRSASQLSVMTVNGGGSGSERRPSWVGGSSNGGAGGAGAPKPAMPQIGAWTAPDSWAVKGDEAGALEQDTSDEEDPADDADADEDLSEGGLSPAIGGDGRTFGAADDPIFGRPGTSNGRPGTKSGRPSTATDRFGRERDTKSFMIRIFRPDSTFSTLPVPLTVTASELTSTLARKFGMNVKSGYALYLREKGLERRVGAHEKPVLLQKRRFEQAGYNELDKLEELGREDNSYLCKLVYKATHASISAAEDDMGDSLEFVDLSGKNVETIPIFLYKHAHEIVSLNLSKNRPFDLPTDFVQLCTSLRELVLSHMGIKRIPQAVKECMSLTRLDISNNHIVELDHIALSELSELTSVKCHNNRLWNLPDYFSELSVLKYLNLSNNRFDSIPLVVCEITSLVELDISFNTVTVVPAQLGQLVQLERLVLLANTINSLPSSFSNLVRLKELDCRRNQIADLSAIAGVAQLEVLRVEHNSASALDAQWSNMRILSASNNSLTRFTLTGSGASLTSLNLSHAKISTLAPDMFTHLGSLETMVLDSNQIRILPDGVGSLSNLVTLSIKNNLLPAIPDTIGKLQRLQSLQVSGNDLHALPASIWLCAQLTSLNASSNLLKDFPDPPLAAVQVDPGLEELDSRKLSTISKAPSTASGRIAPPLALSLQKLYLGDNRLADDVFAPVSLMTELRTLNLSFNDISEIPTSSLFKCQQLEELYLSGNKLTSLPPDDLERLVNLKLIYLNGNKLQTLPSELGKIKKLFALDVGSNVLKYNIANWPYDWNWNWNLELRYLNLSGNKRLEIKPGQQNADTTNLPRNAKRRNLADFSALTKLHILGLMDVTLMIPSVPDESEDRRVRTSLSQINDMGYGIADTLGSRADTLSLVDLVIPRFRSKDDEAIFGIFDAVNKGQNTGAKLVKYLVDSFQAIFTLELSRLKAGEVTSDALRRAFLGINRDYGNLLLPALESRRKDSEISLTDRASASARTGATGIIVYIRRKRMYVANAGNALAVLGGRGGTARLLAKRHEPFEAAEIARIRTAEGWISHRGYVNDEVDVSRSFGFYNVFPAINAAPNIDEFELQETDEFVIIANRGLWEHMSYQAAVDVARTERGDPMAAAAKLRDLAISYGSSSNIMVIVLNIGDLYKAKKGYRSHRTHNPDEDQSFYGAHKAGEVHRRGRDEGAGERYLNLVDREIPAPVGSVCLVFTDIRNSTALWESNPGMQTAFRMHNQLLRRQLRAIGGYEVKTEGDAFMVSFPTVTSAVLWCLTVQQELLREDWPQEILDSEEGKEIVDSRGEVIYRGLAVRMGMHWGAPVCEADPITRRMDYFGPIVNRAARVSAVAEGGQVTASQDVIDILQEVVLEHKPAPSSLDSDSGESEDEEWLDANEKQDVLALRRLGFGITQLGERR